MIWDSLKKGSTMFVFLLLIFILLVHQFAPNVLFIYRGSDLFWLIVGSMIFCSLMALFITRFEHERKFKKLLEEEKGVIQLGKQTVQQYRVDFKKDIMTLGDNLEKSKEALSKTLGTIYVKTDDYLFSAERGANEVYVATRALSDYELVDKGSNEYVETIVENLCLVEPTIYQYLIPKDINKYMEQLKKIVKSKLSEKKVENVDKIMEKCFRSHGLPLDEANFIFGPGFEWIRNDDFKDEIGNPLRTLCFLYIPRKRREFNFLMDEYYTEYYKRLFVHFFPDDESYKANFEIKIN